MFAVLFVAVFDFFALGALAPAVQRGLTGGTRGAELVVAAFSLAYASGLRTGGVLGDRFGTRRLIACGAVGYVVGCVVCAGAPTVTVLLVALAAVPLSLAAARRTRPAFTGPRPRLAVAGTGIAYAAQAVLLLVAALRPHTPAALSTYGAAFAVASLLARRLPRRSWVAAPLLASAGAGLLLTAVPVAIPLASCGAAMGLALPPMTSAALTGAAPGSASRASGSLATAQQFAVAAALTLAGWFL